MQPNENNKKNKLLSNQPLYRCIYLDDETGYLRLACRDEITFYREELANDHGNCTDLDKLANKAKKKWNKYQREIEKKEKNIKNHLNEICKLIDELPSNDRQVQEVLNFILLPLRYLVKHPAFQEEQECRMVYITSLSDEKIKMIWESRQMYIEYKPNVKNAIDKIYLSPGAAPHEYFFKKALNDSKKVRISTNPFRNK